MVLNSTQVMKKNPSVCKWKLYGTCKTFQKNILSKLTFQLEKCQAISVSSFLLTIGHAWN
jgi:hypothetical protein